MGRQPTNVCGASGTMARSSSSRQQSGTGFLALCSLATGNLNQGGARDCGPENGLSRTSTF
eukprot:8007259-Heterocapsa_arctica.AAC.1